MTQHIHEGTPQELAPFLAQRPQGRFRLIELEGGEEPTPAPNESVLAMLHDVAAITAAMKPTDGAETDRLLREARAGAMYSDGTNF